MENSSKKFCVDFEILPDDPTCDFASVGDQNLPESRFILVNWSCSVDFLFPGFLVEIGCHSSWLRNGDGLVIFPGIQN